MTSTGTTADPLAHPMQAASELLAKVGVSELSPQKTSLFQSASEGPAEIAAKITGVKEGKRKDDALYLTSNFGIPWPTGHALNVGGIPVASDVFLMEKQQTFNRSKTVERHVHACGSGAFGYFETTADVSNICKAQFLKGIGTKTPVFVRFSTVTYGREFPDEARDPRGFAIKFYTGEGNYDIVGLNWPVFFVRDPFMGVDVIRSQQRNPQNFFVDWESTFDFMANVPESMHAGMMLWSDHGTPKAWRFNHGYGCHTFKWVNDEGEIHYIKYHFLAEHGQKQFTHEEAVRMCGEDPDYSKRDLWAAIESGDYPTWNAKYQIMTPEQAAAADFDPFDVTKVKFPMHDLGKLVLNKNPDDYHRDVEQAAFSPGSMVPGIEASPDMLLQWRTFFYRDTQYYRLGVNMHQIPVNCPFMAASYSSPNFAGPMRTDANVGKKAHYTPNSMPDFPKLRGDREAPMLLANNVMSREVPTFRHDRKDSEYTQVRELYNRVMDDGARRNLHKNTALGLRWCPELVQRRYLARCYEISPEYAKGIFGMLENPKTNMKEVASLAGNMDSGPGVMKDGK